MHTPEHVLPAEDGFPWWITAEGEQATEALGHRLGTALRGGEIVLLFGRLGAGKTCLTRGLCRGLGISEDVVSPTFTLVNTYRGKLVVHHLDFYRIGPDAPLEDIGVMEILDEVEEGRAVLVAEWPDPLLPELTDLQPVYSWLGVAGARPQERIWRLKADSQAADDMATDLGLQRERERDA